MNEQFKTKITMTNGAEYFSDEEVNDIISYISMSKASNDFMYILGDRYINPNEILSVEGIKDGDREGTVAGSFVVFSGEGLNEDEYWVKSVRGWMPVEDYSGLSDEEFDINAEDVNYSTYVYNEG